jgi:beta-mannosidase
MTCLDLDGIWRLEPDAIDADVPGTVLGAWVKAGTIPDPYYGENEKSITPLFDRDFEYSRTFTVCEELLLHEMIELVCLGIDTLGEIFINEKSIARVNNMHRCWCFDIKKILTLGENTIRVVIFSSGEFIARAYREGRINYISTGGMAGAGYLRKTHCQFGWDWGPQLPDAGIWRSICIEGRGNVKIDDVYVIQEHSAPENAETGETAGGPVTLRIQIKAKTSDLKRFWAEGREIKASIHITPPQSGETINITETIPDITQITELTAVIEKPRLWRPNGLSGKRETQPLYGIEVELLDSRTDNVLDEKRLQIGLRTMTFNADKDRQGRDFAMTVNGIKIFAMGADYIPEDSIFPKINRERTRRLLEDCARANFNSIRVWGGGYYPDDYFYDICDELGLVVWQDFMFACNVYELTDEFAANVAEEVRQNVIRIRHHPCLGLWCGNNEMEMGWVGWEGVKYHHPALKADYIRLFESLIPAVLKETDPQTFYWPSSPSSGGSFDSPNDPDRGDVHFWDVWHGLKPFSEYRKKLLRYCSEFGFQSLPEMETIKSFAETDELNFFSPILEAHQRNPGGNGKILFYISETYRYPKNFASLVYISQILQLESIQTGVDHWRQNRGRCMGAIYWQLNDCWPVTSWASVDYFGRWKALHYGARRFFAPLRATLFVDETESAKPGSLSGPLKRTVRVFVHNDTMYPSSGTLRLFLKDRDFNTLFEETLDVKLPPLYAGEALVRDFRDKINTVEMERSCFVTVELHVDGKRVSKETALFVPPKHFSFRKPKYNVEVRDEEDHFAIAVKADSFCRFTGIKIKGEDPVFSDNFFDITCKNGEEIKVLKSELKKNHTARNLKETLFEIISVGGSY